MATETFKYFRPDPNLRAAYGGGAAANFGDSREITPRELTLRWVCKQMGLPAGGTRFLWEVGLASSVVWFKVSDLHYNAISGYLSAAELATVQSTAPSGYARNSQQGKMHPDSDKITYVHQGDSIGAGTLTTTGNTRDTLQTQAINLMSGETIYWDDTTDYTEGRSRSFRLINPSIGSSSWDNSVGRPDAADGDGATTYPRRQSLSFNQRIKTLPLIGRKMKFGYALGTNDIAYDSSVTGATAWARAETRLAAFRDEFPNTPLCLWTLIKRDELSSLNNRLSAYNDLVRANTAKWAYTVMDQEAKVPQFNIVTGNTLDTTIYADKIHPTTNGNAVGAAQMVGDFEAFLRAA